MKVIPYSTAAIKVEYKNVPSNTFFIWHSKFYFKGVRDVVGFHPEAPVAGDADGNFGEDTLVVIVPHADVRISFDVPRGAHFVAD
jgi:hypothetical protein